MTTISEKKPSSLPELNEEENSKETIEENLPTVEQVLTNHETRLNAIEAALLRIRGAI